MIKRIYDLNDHIQPGKVLVVYGPRRVGKTTLLKQFLNQTQLKYKLDFGDNIQTQHIVSSRDFSQILPYIENYQLIALDEAQLIPQVGYGLKIMVDQRPDVYVIATGSSSFDLSQQIGEPLVGRKWTLTLYPLAQMELLAQYVNRYELQQALPEFLLYGSYPEVVQTPAVSGKIQLLQEIVQAYLLKDILALERVKSPQVLLDLLKLLAFQVGHEVSFHELGTQLGLDYKTVQRYLDLLEKSFIIIRLGAFSRNLRKEIRKKSKYFFIDNGIRNAIISQFNPLTLRNDHGQLWENFIISERLKTRTYKNIYGSTYFWRTHSGAEIDFVEEREGQLFGFECKWSTTKSVTAPKDWLTTYPQASFQVIHPQNYLDFLL